MHHEVLLFLSPFQGGVKTLSDDSVINIYFELKDHLLLYFLGLQNHCSHKIKTLAPWKKSYDKPRQNITKAETLLHQ